MTTADAITLRGLLTIEEAAQYMRISKLTLYAWRKDGLGPRSYKIGNGRRSYYSVADIDQWIDAQLKPSDA